MRAADQDRTGIIGLDGRKSRMSPNPRELFWQVSEMCESGRVALNDGVRAIFAR